MPIKYPTFFAYYISKQNFPTVSYCTSLINLNVLGVCEKLFFKLLATFPKTTYLTNLFICDVMFLL